MKKKTLKKIKILKNKIWKIIILMISMETKKLYQN